jgi:hypothetical protein
VARKEERQEWGDSVEKLMVKSESVANYFDIHAAFLPQSLFRKLFNFDSALQCVV